MSNPTTLSQFINWAAEQLQQNSDSARLDAKILLCHVGHYSDVDLILKADQLLDQELVSAYQQVITKRQQGTPVAYLTGQKEFWSLALKVTADTLIPRPETELLVETALTLIPEANCFDIADLGTGSGAIACAIAKERPNVKIIATDKSLAALAVAQENIQRHGLNNISVVQSDWFENLGNQQFDMIVSNPPYVASEDKNLSEGDVRFEPDLALTPGTNGLKDLKHIIQQSITHLKTNGYLLVEHGYDQEQQVRQLFKGTTKSGKNVIPTERRIMQSDSRRAYKNVSCLKDLNDKPRLTYAQMT